jgi:hypothetical protein
MHFCVAKYFVKLYVIWKPPHQLGAAIKVELFQLQPRKTE